jgi:hypothetical protein
MVGRFDLRHLLGSLPRSLRRLLLFVSAMDLIGYYNIMDATSILY